MKRIMFSLSAWVFMPLFLYTLVNGDSISNLKDIALSMQESNLEILLKKTQDYCEKVKQSALHYICKEKITDRDYKFDRITTASGLQREERILKVRGIETQKFLYDYQLIKKDDEFKEQRILLEENGKKKYKKDVELDKLKYFSQYLVYGPVGFLSGYWQEHFHYEILGEEKIGEEKALIVQATPITKREENYNIGKIWVGPKCRILRIEWEPISIQYYKDEAFDSRLGEFKKRIVWTVDYGVEKNGVRFPSRQTVREIFIVNIAGGKEYKAVKRETVFEYIDYKFFIVETEIKYSE